MLPYAPWLCWLIPVIGAVFTPIFARINSKLRNYAPVAFAAASVVFSISMIPDVFTGNVVDWVSGKTLGPIPYDWQTQWVGSLGINLGVLVDPLSVLMTSLVCSIGLLVLIFSLEYMRGDPGLTRYWFLTQFFIGGLSMVVMAGNLLQLYIGWEIVGVCCYALVSFWYRDPQNARYGLKTFLMLRVGDVFLLASILIMYFYSGNFDFMALKDSNGWMLELSRSGLLLITALMFFGGAISKSAQFPLHVWLPDAMPATPASFNAITEVLAGGYLVARALPMFHDALFIGGCGELTLFFLAVAWIGAFTALLGASMAMVQRNLVRVLAYSIISQYAYMMVGLGVGGLMIDPAAGYLAGNLHLMADAIISGLLFLCGTAVLHRVGSQDMFDMGGLRARMPITFICMGIGALATIGIPPLSGFWSEESIYGAILELAQEAGNQGSFTLMLSAYGLYFLMMVTAAVTTFYILRMMGMVFGGKSKHVEKIEDEGAPIKEVSSIMWVPMGVAALATVVIGVLAPFIITEFHEFFSSILRQSVVHGGFIDVLRKAFLSPSFIITCVALAIGGYPAYKLYITRQADPVKLTEEHPFLKEIHKFLWNGCYIDALYDKIADGTKELCRVVCKRVEVGVFDAFNYFVAECIEKFYRAFRKMQTGELSWNMILVMLGATLLLILMLLSGEFAL
ncbi:MAG: proton-conducting transporter membrane subunit [Candidatus Bathyarchaeia archaeon]|nr:proton-conducting transporter membrane subunit [Candidatus Bathyarchaeia archaeon]